MVKAGNVVKAYKNSSMESLDEIIRLSSLLLRNGIEFGSNHPNSMKHSIASKTPANMRADLLRG